MSRGALVADRYRLEKLLARGGVSEVYRARDIQDGNTLAIKLMPPAALALPGARPPFEPTAILRTGVRHPSVVQVFDCGEMPDGRIYVAMELVDGEDLHGLLLRVVQLHRLLKS